MLDPILSLRAKEKSLLLPLVAMFTRREHPLSRQTVVALLKRRPLEKSPNTLLLSYTSSLLVASVATPSLFVPVTENGTVQLGNMFPA